MWVVNRELSIIYNIIISIEDVRKTAKMFNSYEAKERKWEHIKWTLYRANGPADIYHIDGTELMEMKNSKGGFFIHNCVDGFMRKIVWLHVVLPNNNPFITTVYFLTCIEKNKLVS